MGNEFEKLQRVGNIMAEHGWDLAVALVVLIAGLYLSKLIARYLRIGLGRFMKSQSLISIICNSVYILFLLSIIMAATTQAGFKPQIIFRFLMVAGLAAIGVLVLFRPYMPTLPYKVGNTIKVGDMLGKVEATTFLNTRMKTFDGLTVFIPNRQILDDIVINYHFTATRRVKALL